MWEALRINNRSQDFPHAPIIQKSKKKDIFAYNEIVNILRRDLEENCKRVRICIYPNDEFENRGQGAIFNRESHSLGITMR